MARRGSLRKRLEALEEAGVTGVTVAMYTEGPEGQHWLLLSDGSQYEGEEAVRRAATAVWPDTSSGGIVHVVGVDLDVVCGLKPAPDAETLLRWQEANRQRQLQRLQQQEQEQQDGAEDQTAEVAVDEVEAAEIEAAQVVPTETADDR